MKIVSFLISVLFVLCFKNENLDKCKGIDDFVFGTPREHFKSLILEMEEGNSQLYSVNPENIKISDVRIDYLRVSFIKNKLSAISISTKNSTGSAFLKYLNDMYGVPVRIKNQYEWSGKHVSITLEMFTTSKDAAIDFYSK